jgi:hypothetical protein
VGRLREETKRRIEEESIGKKLLIILTFFSGKVKKNDLISRYWLLFWWRINKD